MSFAPSEPEPATTGGTSKPSAKTIVIAESALGSQPGEIKVSSFGDYELLDEIARGGMGVVYKARQISLNRLVALKMILAGEFASEAQIKRFGLETEAASQLSHPNIVRLFEVGSHHDQRYFSMEYIEGRSLRELEAQGRWQTGDGKELAAVLAKVARAVQFAHEHGILHRDLKPANILISADGEPHVLDFGVARRIGADSSLTMEGAVVGTPSFMAPEQAAGETKGLGTAADIYSLGAILYFLIAGRPPFVATSTLDTLVQVLEGEVIVPRVINPNVPPDLERICLCCLEKSPENRYQSAANLAEDLERFCRDEPVQARPPGLRSLLIHWLRRQPALVSRLLGVGICILIAQLTFHYHPTVSLIQHTQIVSALGIWILLSIICQWCLEYQPWQSFMPFVWIAVDTLCLSATLWLDEAMPGPLVIGFPVLVAASGLWFRAPVVALATLLSVIGYSGLLLANYWRQGRLEQLNWHIAFLVLLVLAGCSVAYQVHRVRALSRYYGHGR